MPLEQFSQLLVDNPGNSSGRKTISQHREQRQCLDYVPQRTGFNHTDTTNLKLFEPATDIRLRHEIGLPGLIAVAACVPEHATIRDWRRDASSRFKMGQEESSERSGNALEAGYY